MSTEMKAAVMALMTTEEAAEFLRVPVRTLYDWRYFSKGPRSFKVGKYVRYRQSDLEEWLESQVSEPRKAA